MDIRTLRRTAHLTQMELSQRSDIGRTKLSFAECGYIELDANEEESVRRAITQAANNHVASVQSALDAETTSARHKVPRKGN